MGFIKTLFGEMPKPKPAPVVPATDDTAVQQAAADAKKRAALAVGRSSTVLAGNGLGSVGGAGSGY